MSNDLTITEYDSGWPLRFAELSGIFYCLLGDMVAAIEHVGSTSVPGLAAKPIIDLDILLSNKVDLPEVIRRLATLGYLHQGDFGISGREAFRLPDGPFDHHLYVCLPDCHEFRRHVTLRDYLRSHPAEARAYHELKWSLWTKYGNDRIAYMRGKDDFVRQLVERAIFAGRF